MNLTQNDFDFLERWLTGEGANEDTDWRARYMMQQLMESINAGQLTTDGQSMADMNSLVAEVESLKAQLAAQSTFRNMIIQLSKRHNPEDGLSAQSTDNEILREINNAYILSRQAQPSAPAPQPQPFKPQPRAVTPRPVGAATSNPPLNNGVFIGDSSAAQPADGSDFISRANRPNGAVR